jgi:hypothetical protein
MSAALVWGISSVQNHRPMRVHREEDVRLLSLLTQAEQFGTGEPPPTDNGHGADLCGLAGTDEATRQEHSAGEPLTAKRLMIMDEHGIAAQRAP